MWFLIAWLILLPLGWAVAGAPDLGNFAPSGWLTSSGPLLPTWLTEPAMVGNWTLLVAAVFGLALALGPTRALTVHVGTTVHEVGHGLTAAALGGVVTRITMTSDGSGQATTGLPRGAGLRSALVTLAGYLAPGIVGLASLQMAFAGLGAAWIGYLTLVTVVMLLLTMRSWWAVLVSTLIVAAGFLLVTQTPATTATVTAGVLAGLLLARGVSDAANQQAAVRAGARTDAGSLARQTGLPVKLFAGLHQVLAMAMAGAAIWILLSAVR